MYFPEKLNKTTAPFHVYLRERAFSHSSLRSKKGSRRCRIVRTTGCTTFDSFARYLIQPASTKKASKIKRLAALVHLHVQKRAAPALTSPTTTKPPPIASLGTIPAELRRLIFSYCCCHHEDDICSMPTDYETSILRRYGRKLPKGPNMFARSPPALLIDEIKYDPEWPAVALMGVSRLIRDDVLPILFGKNTWRFSYQLTPRSNPNRIRTLKKTYYLCHEEYSSYFRDISCYFHAQDVPQACLVRRLRIESGPDPDSTWDLMSGAHNKNVDLLVNEPMWEKIWRINQMENLDRIHIGLGSLACPGGCCRAVVFKKFIKCWKPGMKSRLSKWGPTSFMRGSRPQRAHQLYVKGEKRKLLAVHGMWTKKEVFSLLKHWLSPEARDIAVSNTMLPPGTAAKKRSDAFFADIEPDKPSFLLTMNK